VCAGTTGPGSTLPASTKPAATMRPFWLSPVTCPARCRGLISSRRHSQIFFSATGLPEDTAPLLRLIGALGRDAIDLVAFTSASQVSNLFTVAQCDGKEASLKQSLGRTLVASIGPVCSAALRKLAVRVDIEAQAPKLGPFMDPLGKS
jgi:Uroporphyrinogen-III synthase HemD